MNAIIKTFLFTLLSIVASYSYSAKHFITIYGVDSAEHFQTKHSGVFYIQLGSFSKQLNASRLQKIAESKTNSPVTIVKKNKQYVVAIGPLHSVSEVQAIAYSYKTSLERVKIPSLKVIPPNSPSPLRMERSSLKRNTSAVTSLTVGPVWENAGSTQTFYMAPEIDKTFVAKHATNTLINGELFVGIEKPFMNMFQGQLGLAFAASGNATLSGIIWDDADSEFDNYSYQYQVRHAHLAIKGKLLADHKSVLIPWVSGSMGVGFNQSYGFNNVPLIPEAIMMPNFSSKSQTSFTYTVGTGLQTSFDAHWQLGIGYEFSDWGRSHLGLAAGQTINSGLGLNHLYTNGLVGVLSYKQ